jgi:hypothetical protein
MIFCDRTGVHDIWVTAVAWPLATAAPWGSDELNGKASSSYDIKSGEVLRGNQSSDFRQTYPTILGIQIFYGYLLFRHMQTFLQLRDMEHVMHIGQLWQQLQLVSYFTSLFQNLKWSNKYWCELASYLETT